MPVINSECAAHKKVASCDCCLQKHRCVKNPRLLAVALANGAATAQPQYNLSCKEPVVLTELQGLTNPTPDVNCPCCANKLLPLVLTLHVLTQCLWLSDP